MMPIIFKSMSGSRKEAQMLADKLGEPVLIKKKRRPKRKTIVIEPMSFDQAKERVSNYLKKKGTAATDELNEKLHIDLGLLVEVLDDLKKEGRIRERDL